MPDEAGFFAYDRRRRCCVGLFADEALARRAAEAVPDGVHGSVPAMADLDALGVPGATRAERIGNFLADLDDEGRLG